MIYYRVAWKTNQLPVWQWKSTKLTSLEALFGFLRMYSPIAQDRLRVFSSSSLESMDEMLMRENKGWESTSVTAEEFLRERRIQIQERTQRASEEYPERGAIAVTTRPLVDESSSVKQSLDRWNESGGADTARKIHIPAAFSKLYQSEYDWSYSTEEQEHLKQRTVYIPRGKVLGGSSSINTMIYTRGNCYDYDHWCALGNPGWSYADVLPYFKKAEHQERGASAYHGVGGPLNVADLRCVNPLTRAFVAAGVELGWPHNADFNGAAQEGVGLYQVTQKQGQRHSTAEAYLKPARKRRNLTVLPRAHVTRLLFEQRRCVGVAYLQ